jgi:hypothetical protein
MERQVRHTCEIHSDPSDCPDALIAFAPASHEFGIRVHDGGGSFVTIAYCPWCGARLTDSSDTPTDPYLKLRPSPATDLHETCLCAHETPIILQPHLTRNPLSCARCNLEVPPERVGFDSALADALSWWRDFHDAFYCLWLDSGEYEEWAATQLRGASSPVNVRGLELARRLTAWRRCYLWWFQDEEAPDRASVTQCPRCSRLLDVRFEGERPHGGALYVCEACLIAVHTP